MKLGANLRQAWIIFLKETIDNSRDWRSLGTSLLTAVGLPILMVGLFAFVKKDTEQKLDKVIEVEAEGLEHAGILVDFFRDYRIELKPMSKDKKAEDVAKDEGLALSFAPSIRDAIRRSELAEVRVYYDGSRTEQSLSANRLESVLNRFSNTMFTARLGNLGIRQEQMEIIAVNNIDVSDQGAMMVSMILGMLPMVMIAAALSGGHYLAVDITAGELEKKTLEPLRQLPISLQSLLGGKLLAVFNFCSLSALLGGLGFYFISRLEFVRAYTEINIQLHFLHLTYAFLLLLPFCFLAAALELLIGTFTKTVKEAQTYISILVAAGSLPTYLMAILDMKEKAWSLYIPVVSQYFLISRWQRGQAVSVSEILIVCLVTLALAVGAFFLAMMFYKREPVAS